MGTSLPNRQVAEPRLSNVPKADNTTPIRRQYLDVKKRYPHAIVFFRLGDFYETFDDDARLVAKELSITLTSKPDDLQDVERRIQTLERELAAHKRDKAGGVPGRDPRIAELDVEIAASKTEQKALTERWTKEKTAVDKVLALRRQLEGGTKPKRGETIKRDKEPKKDEAAL